MAHGVAAGVRSSGLANAIRSIPAASIRPCPRIRFMDKRVLLSTILSLAFVCRSAPATESKPAAEAKPAATETAPAAPIVTGPKIEQATVEQPGHYHATFTNRGAAPEHWVLLNPQYKEDKPRESNKVAQPIDLVRTLAPTLPAVISFPASSFKLDEDTVWTQQSSDNGVLVYTYESDGVRVTKRFEALPNSYQLQLTITVENSTDKPTDHYLRLTMYGWQDPTVKPGGFLSRRVSQTEGVCDVNGKLKKANLEAILKKGLNSAAVDEQGKVKWLGIAEQYFVMLAALQSGDDSRRCEVFGEANGTIKTALTTDKHTVPAHGKVEYQALLFMGPKILAQLDAVRVAGQDPGMGDVMDYGMFGLTELFARPMLAILKAVHAVIPAWGFAIIIVTILVKALTWWPTSRSMKSMKAMTKLKPEMDKLKARYGDDKNAMNLAMMELYKKHGVNPLGGCLPILIQMPVYIALYSMLGNSVELYRSSFLWIKDLTAPDPYFVLPLLTGVLMFLQQRTQPMNPDPQQATQQKTMMYTMPVLFTVLNIFWPAGLTIYILTNTILTFVQQWWLNRGDQPSKPAPAKPARA
jgi:YidC/Oxa1 family membrane protein insertase